MSGAVLSVVERLGNSHARKSFALEFAVLSEIHNLRSFDAAAVVASDAGRAGAPRCGRRSASFWQSNSIGCWKQLAAEILEDFPHIFGRLTNLTSCHQRWRELSVNGHALCHCGLFTLSFVTVLSHFRVVRGVGAPERMCGSLGSSRSLLFQLKSEAFRSAAASSRAKF
jgi:hypothetical protein